MFVGKGEEICVQDFMFGKSAGRRCRCTKGGIWLMPSAAEAREVCKEWSDVNLGWVNVGES
jgi:hypothetical protein